MRGLSRTLGRAQKQAAGLTRERLAAIRAGAGASSRLTMRVSEAWSTWRSRP